MNPTISMYVNVLFKTKTVCQNSIRTQINNNKELRTCVNAMMQNISETKKGFQKFMVSKVEASPPSIWAFT